MLFRSGPEGIEAGKVEYCVIAGNCTGRFSERCAGGVGVKTRVAFESGHSREQEWCKGTRSTRVGKFGRVHFEGGPQARGSRRRRFGGAGRFRRRGWKVRGVGRRRGVVVDEGCRTEGEDMVGELLFRRVP